MEPVGLPSPLTPSRPKPLPPTSRRTSAAETGISPPRKTWAPITPPSASGAVAASVDAVDISPVKAEAGESGSTKRKKLERDLSDLILKSGNSPPKLSAIALPQASKDTARIDPVRTQSQDYINTVQAASAGPSRRRGWGESLVGGAVSAGVYGAALGVTAYKLWKQSSSQNFDLSIPSNRAALQNGEASSSRRTEEDSERPPPPAYREREREGSSDTWEWADEIEDEAIITPTTSRHPTVRLAKHQHPLLHNTPNRSWGRKRRPRLGGAFPIRATMANGMLTERTLDTAASAQAEQPEPAVRGETEAEPEPEPEREGDIPASTITQEQDDILDRLDEMTLQIQRLIMEGQAALLRTSKDLEREDQESDVGMGGRRKRRTSRIGRNSISMSGLDSPGGSIGKAGGKRLRPRVGRSSEGGGGVTKRTSLPVVGITTE